MLFVFEVDNVICDDGYGISERLIIDCTLENNKDDRIFYQLFNENELLPLKEELIRNKSQIKMINLNIFNLTVWVYEMLYGTDLINKLIKRSMN